MICAGGLTDDIEFVCRILIFGMFTFFRVAFSSLLCISTLLFFARLLDILGTCIATIYFLLFGIVLSVERERTFLFLSTFN
jgi:hypothetical protein